MCQAYGGESLRNDTAGDLAGLLQPVFTHASVPIDRPLQGDLFEDDRQPSVANKSARFIRVQVSAPALRTGTLNLDEGFVDGSFKPGERLDIVARSRTFQARVDPALTHTSLHFESARVFFDSLQIADGDWLELRENDDGHWNAIRTAR